MTSAISCPLWSSVYECQRVDAFLQADGLYHVYTSEDVALYTRAKPHSSLFIILIEHNVII